MKLTRYLPEILLSIICLQAESQTSATDLLGDSEEIVDYATGTFKSSRIINGHSIENPAKGELEFRISHRFGQLSGGLYEYFGLDEATIHFSLEYSPMDRLTIGLGRSNYLKTYDAYAKLELLRQKSGKENFPFFLTYFTSFEASVLRNEIPDYEARHRFSYVHQLLIARKFGERLSLQLTPSLVHKNAVENTDFPNDTYALGVGGRIKITKRLTLNAEWFPIFNLPEGDDYTNIAPFSIGFDLETGGHVFQIMVTNAQAMREAAFITNTQGSWLDGDIHLGFNISRMFNLHE
jgi:hypothetical protein